MLVNQNNLNPIRTKVTEGSALTLAVWGAFWRMCAADLFTLYTFV